MRLQARSHGLHTFTALVLVACEVVFVICFLTYVPEFVKQEVNGRLHHKIYYSMKSYIIAAIFQNFTFQCHRIIFTDEL